MEGFTHPPGNFFVLIMVIVLIVFGFRLLRYTQRERTIRLALEKGADLSKLVAEVTAGPLEPREYLLRGLLWGMPGVLIGVGTTWSAVRLAIPSHLTAFGWIPAAIGAAYLIFFRLGPSTKSEGGTSSPPSMS